MVPPNQLSKEGRKFTKIIICVLFILLSFKDSYGQIPTANYFTGNVTGNLEKLGILGVGSGTVTSPLTAHTYLTALQFYYGTGILNSASITTPAIVRASRDVSIANVILAGSDARIQFRLSSGTISSGITTYIKIGSAPSITGLAAPLGGLLGLSNIYDIQGSGYSGASAYSTTASLGAGAENVGTLAGTLAGTLTQLVIDSGGIWHAAVTPNGTYNSVRLRVGFPSGVDLVSLSRNLDVNAYNAFYYNAPGGPDCGTPIFTTPGEVTGVSLNLSAVTSLLALDTAVKNPQLAIDASNTTYSRITSGALGIATSVSQTILFNSTTGLTTDLVKLKLSLPASMLTVALLSNISVTAYNKTTQVGTSKSFSDLLTLDVLGLLSDNTPFTINLAPGGQFDRVKITLGNTISLGANVLGGGLRIYDVVRVSQPPAITLQPVNDTVCAGQTATLKATATGPNISYAWEYYNGTIWTAAGTGSQLTIANTTTAMNGRKYRVNITGGYCATVNATITSSEATLMVRSLPVTPPVGIQP